MVQPKWSSTISKTRDDEVTGCRSVTSNFSCAQLVIAAIYSNRELLCNTNILHLLDETIE